MSIEGCLEISHEELKRLIQEGKIRIGSLFRFPNDECVQIVTGVNEHKITALKVGDYQQGDYVPENKYLSSGSITSQGKLFGSENYHCVLSQIKLSKDELSQVEVAA